MFEWQQKVGFPAEMRLTNKETATQLAEEFVSGVIANGTTTVAAFGSAFASEVDASFSVFARRGLRAIYGTTLADTDMPAELSQNTDKALDEARALAAKWHGKENGRLLYAFGPRASIKCSEKLMRGAAALADMLKCYLQTHVAESLDELAEVHKRFPDQVDEVDLFSELGLLRQRTLLAHGVLLNSQQRRDVAEAGTALIHCPTGNLFRESGLMDYCAHRAAGIRIALGSSIAGGFDPFMPRVAVEGLQTAKAIKVHSLPRRSGPGDSTGRSVVGSHRRRGGGAGSRGSDRLHRAGLSSRSARGATREVDQRSAPGAADFGASVHADALADRARPDRRETRGSMKCSRQCGDIPVHCG